MKVASTANSTVLSNRIRAARKRANLSQAALARALSVTASAVSQWENPNGTKPDLDSVVGMASATHVSLDWLLTGKGKATRHPAKEREDVQDAVVLSAFALDIFEENLLEQFRKISIGAREHFVGLLEEIVGRRSPRLAKHR